MINSKKINSKLLKLQYLILGLAYCLCAATFPLPIQAQDGIEGLKKTSQAFNKVAEKSIPSVVTISTIKTISRQYYNNPFYNSFGSDFYSMIPESRRDYQHGGLGSGVIFSKDGYILTNNHVIDKVDEITVVLSDDREFEAELIGTDPKTDLALLKIKGDNFPAINLGNSEEIKVGDWAIAVGSPFGLKSTVTAGIISAKGRSDVDIVDYANLIQTDAAINRGNSGGALLNIDGELVGINTAIVSGSGGFVGVGFAVPVNMAQRVVKDLKQRGQVIRGWIGIYIQPITDQLQSQFKLPKNEGALISDIIPNSPADVGGLQRGDTIVSYDNKKIKDIKSLRYHVAETPVGDSVAVEFYRNKERLTRQITIQSQEDRAAIKTEHNTSHLSIINQRVGFSVKSNTEKLRRRYNVYSKEGVVITEINPKSKAESIGLEVGDVILEANYQSVRTEKDFNRIINKLNENSQILLVIKSKKTTHFVVLPIS